MNGPTLAAQVAGRGVDGSGARLALRRHPVASRREVRTQDKLALDLLRDAGGGTERKATPQSAVATTWLNAFIQGFSFWLRLVGRKFAVRFTHARLKARFRAAAVARRIVR